MIIPTIAPSPTPTIANSREAYLPHPAKIVDIKEEAYAITTYTLVLEDETRREQYRFEAGQFNMLYLPGSGEVPISISSDPAEPQRLGHTIRFAGSVTRAMGCLQVGDIIGLRGPYGSAWSLNRLYGEDIYIVTGGIGLAPLRPILYTIIRQRDQFGRVALLYGARTPADMLYTAEFEHWQAYDIQLHTTVDRADAQWRGQVGVVPMLFYHLRLDPRKSVVLTCGPEVMIRFVVYEALARRVPKEKIFVSMERNMKCALGFCGHCQLGPSFICKDGPVLTYAQIEPFFGVEDF